MATRRIPEKPAAAAESVAIASTQQNASDTSAAVPTSTVYKLLLFTLAMISLPLSSYFLIVKVTKGDTFWGAVTAAVVANLVLVGYILVAVEEDRGEMNELAQREGKKGR